MFLRHSLACFCEPLQIMSHERWMKHVLPDLLGWFPCTITRGHELSQLFLKQICLLINHILSHTVWEPWWRGEHMTIMLTQHPTTWTPQLCGLPQGGKVHKRCCQCAVTITTDHLRHSQQNLPQPDQPFSRTLGAGLQSGHSTALQPLSFPVGLPQREQVQTGHWGIPAPGVSSALQSRIRVVSWILLAGSSAETKSRDH